MIKKLQNNELKIAEKIRAVFQVSYKVEAKLLGAVNFPPLHRPLDKYRENNTEFYGYSKDGELAGIVEIDANNNGTKPLGEEEMYETPKQSVFSPNINERKTKYTKRK